jgi:NTE family protein
MRKIGLALGGGGARGLAHVGILRAFENRRIPVHCISGTSMGAIIGAAYSVEPDSVTLEQKVRDALKSKVFSKMRFDAFKKDSKEGFISRARRFLTNGYFYIIEETRVGMLELEQLEAIVELLVPDIRISDTIIPFSCVATDLSAGRARTFEKGSLRNAVMASASIPGLFPPVLIDGDYYSDGGQVNNTPVNAVKKLGAEVAIACEVKCTLLRYDKFEKARDVLSRSNNITEILLHELQLKDADFVISPPIKHLHWTDFDKIDVIIKKAEEEAYAQIRKLDLESKPAGFFQRIKSLFAKTPSNNQNSLT